MTQSLKAPLVGITTSGRNGATAFSLMATYVDAVRAAGGVPVMLPPGEPDPEAILDRLDGLILSGGGDINPALYNGTAHEFTYNIDRERDESELALAHLALDRDLPVLGICRGMELLVVACGGTLVPHLPDEYGTKVNHRLNPSPGLLYPSQHYVRITPGSRLAGIVGNAELAVVSWHHQAVRTIPPGWRVVAHSVEDNAIEAVEHQHCGFAIAVQWHPELSPGDTSHQRIFQSLVAAARQRSQLPFQEAIA